MARHFMWWLVLSLSLSLAAGCSGPKEEKNQARRPAVPVSAAEAEVRDMPVLIKAVGNVESLALVNVKPQVGGVIERQLVAEGQEVSKGTPLFQIDPRPYQAVVKEMQGKLEKDVALLRQAEEDLVRYSRLQSREVVSKQQADQAESQAKSLRGSIRTDEAQLEQARLNLEYATIRAPLAGRVGQILVNEGNYVKAADDRILLVITQFKPIYVSFSAPEAVLSDIAARFGREPLTVEAWPSGAENAAPETGKLVFVDNAVDRTTGTIKLKASFDNAGNRLWPGQFAKVSMRLGLTPNAVVAPAQAVQVGPSGAYVYVVKPDNTVEMRLVTVDRTVENDAVVTKGLAAGEKIVVDGHVRLAPGAAVSVKGAPGAPQSAEAKPGEAKSGEAKGKP